ncbi:MAG: hypothetical protein KKD18_02120 [Nanoarchaeota archaeon]|nr:hypothetical protein [Nanoarchaeota archaeon]MBU0977187.1 hypothetical protein [Nanoarchaeota archaeon]
MIKIEASMVLEILGRPKEHVTEALNSIVATIGTEKEIKIIDKKIHEPLPVEKTDLFTSFAELDVVFESLMSYINTIFKYMPSNVQIISPEKLNISNMELNEIGNAVTQRLHRYDAVTKSVVAERDMYAKKLHEIAPHLFKKEDPPQPAPKKEEKPEKKKSKKKSR